MALSASYNRQARGEGRTFSLPVAENTHIYKGGLVAINSSGYAVPAASTAGLKVIGVAYEEVDNNPGSNGALKVRVECGREFLFTFSSITQAMLGRAMFVVDDATLDETDSDNISAGVLTEYVSATSGWVFIPLPSGALGNGMRVVSGQHTTVAASDTVVTGLALVAAVVVSLGSDPVDDPMLVTASIGDQAGAPAAGSVLIKTWKNTSGTDPTPAAATTFSKVVNWIAVGY